MEGHSISDRWIRESLNAVHESKYRIHHCNGWQALQERDQDGQPKGPLPYTDTAIAEFLQAYEHNPEDPQIRHHLAICFHARAWDLELHGDPKAEKEWERALGFWRSVITSPAFWKQLKQKLAACDPDADPTILNRMRDDLYEHLLDIHVDFIRHYFETRAPDRAVAHVRLIHRSRIPPAVRARLADKVFDAMTVNVPQLRAMQEFKEALALIDRFLTLFETHVQALRMHAEICKDLVSQLSYMDDWDDIRALADRAEPHAVRLAAHERISSTPLAKTALEELAMELMMKGMDHANLHVSQMPKDYFSTKKYDAAENAFEFAARWGWFALPASSSGSGFKPILAGVINSHAVLCYNCEIPHVQRSGLSNADKLQNSIYLARKVLSMMEKSVDLSPSDQQFQKNLDVVSDALTNLETEARFLRLFSQGEDS